MAKMTKRIGWMVAILVSALAFPPNASAATLCVNTTGAGGCHTSIQTAINAAAAGDTIDVAAGTYNELVNVNKANLALVGAAGAAIDHPGAGFAVLTVAANGVTVSGLSVTSSPTGPNAAKDFLVFVAGDGATLSNLVLNHQRTVGGAPIAVASDSDGLLVSGGTVTSGWNGIITVGVGPWIGVEISGVTFNTNGGEFAILMHSGTDFVVRQNTFNSGPLIVAQLIIENIAEVTVENNVFLGGAPLGIHVGNFHFGANVVMDSVTIRDNAISGATTAGILLATTLNNNGENPNVIVLGNEITANALGLRNSALSTVPLASLNWWGSATGPIHALNPVGTGNGIDGNTVVYQAWCVAASPC